MLPHSSKAIEFSNNNHFSLVAQQAMMDSSASSTTPGPLYLHASGEKEKEVSDCKMLVQQMLHTLKTLLFTMINYGKQLQQFLAQQHQQQVQANPQLQSVPAPQSPVPPGMTEDEVRVVARILLSGLDCLKVTAFDNTDPDLYRSFAEVFTVLERTDFVDIFTGQIESLYNAFVADLHVSAMLATLCQASQAGQVSKTYTFLLLAHFVHRPSAVQ